MINTEEFNEVFGKSKDNIAEQENRHIESSSDTTMDCISIHDLTNPLFQRKNEYKLPSADK